MEIKEAQTLMGSTYSSSPQENTSPEEFQKVLKAGQINSTKSKQKDSIPPLFQDPQSMLKLWMVQEQYRNPFADDQKDPFESVSKILESFQSHENNSILQQVKENLQKNYQFSALGLIGRTFESSSNEFSISGEIPYKESFKVPEEACGYHVFIKNTSGEIVKEVMDYQAGPGLHNFTWDRKDNDGNLLPIEEYKVDIQLVKQTDSEKGVEYFNEGYVQDLNGKEICEKACHLDQQEKIKFNYQLPMDENIQKATIWITNEKGIPVGNSTIDATPGMEGTYEWDRLNKDGQPVEAGNYKVVVTVKDQKNKPLDIKEKPSVTTYGRVDGVDLSNLNDMQIISNGMRMPLKSIKSIQQDNN